MNTTKLWYNEVPFNAEHTTFTNYYYHWWDPNQVYGPGLNNPPQTITTTTLLSNFLDKIPEVYITKNKNRLKVYNNQVHLNDGDEFELELFNTSPYVLGVKFKLNGEYISNQHLILQPGQHFFLDRYLNEKKKFKYSTYEVEKNNTKVDIAIINNGAVEIEFYKEIQNTYPPTSEIYGAINSNYSSNDIIGASNINCFYSSTLDNEVTLDGMDTTFTTTNLNTNKNVLRSMNETKSFHETGRIDKGGKSDQEFNEVDMNFETSIYFTSVMKIMPMSKKPIEAKDLKPSCSSCNRKCKKTDKFCSLCGIKI